MTFLKTSFCSTNSIVVDAMSAIVLLMDHRKTKLYFITN